MTLNKAARSVHCETDKTNKASVPDPPFFARGGLRQTTKREALPNFYGKTATIILADKK